MWLHWLDWTRLFSKESCVGYDADLFELIFYTLSVTILEPILRQLIFFSIPSPMIFNYPAAAIWKSFLAWHQPASVESIRCRSWLLSCTCIVLNVLFVDTPLIWRHTSVKCFDKTSARDLWSLSREGSLSCHTCCDTGPRFLRSQPKNRHLQ